MNRKHSFHRYLSICSLNNTGHYLNNKKLFPRRKKTAPFLYSLYFLRVAEQMSRIFLFVVIIRQDIKTRLQYGT